MEMIRDYTKVSSFPRTMQPLARRVLKAGKEYVLEQYEKGYTPGWPEKFASIILTWHGNHYSIPYYVFGIENTDQTMIYSLSDHLGKEFAGEKIKIFAVGFMD